MFKAVLQNTIYTVVLALVVLSSCKEKTTLKPKQTDFSFKEGFDTVANLYNRGWVFVNNSRPIGFTTWMQGVFEDGKFGVLGWPAYEYNYAGTDYAYVENSCANGSATISCWMISPVLNIKNGDKISFYARATDDPAAKPDRLQFRVNLASASADVGTSSTSVGDFKDLLIDINNTYCKTCPTKFPTTWTKLEVTLINGSATPIPGRVAFRYFVEGGGPDGIRSAAIGIDSFEFTSAK
jgi:hypothetical protein